ncbi:MAG: hypothetical protein JO227_18415 [Acetobacteraceae bacterium]|nr:hypothetical protein [Acetobacteraceae bacterium]
MSTTNAFLVPANKALLTYRFDAQAVEDSTTALFSEFVPWRAETKQIVLTRGETILAKRTVSANKPTVQVTRPTPGETWGVKATEHPPLVSILNVADGKVVSRQSAQFTGAAYDARDGMLPATRLRWTSDRDGVLDIGQHITTVRPLSTGAHVITLNATNSQGQVASKQMTVVAK